MGVKTTTTVEKLKRYCHPLKLDKLTEDIEKTGGRVIEYKGTTLTFEIAVTYTPGSWRR